MCIAQQRRADVDCMDLGFWKCIDEGQAAVSHGAAEIVLMISGDTEMEIGNQFYKAYDGDVYFLESEIPHAIENLDENQAMYFAFQWE